MQLRSIDKAHWKMLPPPEYHVCSQSLLHTTAKGNKIQNQDAHYSGRGAFLDIKCKAYCDKTPLSPSQNQAIQQPFIRKTEPSTVSLSSQSTAFIIMCTRYQEIKTKERLVICPTGAGNRKEEDLYSVFRAENQNTVMKSVGSEVRLTVMQSQLTTCSLHVVNSNKGLSTHQEVWSIIHPS